MHSHPHFRYEIVEPSEPDSYNWSLKAYEFEGCDIDGTNLEESLIVEAEGDFDGLRHLFIHSSRTDKKFGDEGVVYLNYPRGLSQIITKINMLVIDYTMVKEDIDLL